MKKTIVLIIFLLALNGINVNAEENNSVQDFIKKTEVVDVKLNEDDISVGQNIMTEQGIKDNTLQNTKENEKEEIDQENKEIFSENIQEEDTTQNVQSGWVQQEGKWFYYDINGNKLFGWQYIGSGVRI